MKHLLRTLKNALPLPREHRPFRIQTGIARGVVMEMSFAYKLQRYIGIEEREIFADFRRLTARSAALLDIGASDGIYPLAAINLNPNIRCLGVDASAEVVAQVERNKALNKDRLPVDHIQWKTCFIGTQHVTLDAIARELPRPLLIKMDIDGGEVDALSSGLETLSGRDVALIVEIHSDELEAGCIKLLTDLGYRCTVRRNAWWRALVPEQRPIPTNHWFVAERPGD